MVDAPKRFVSYEGNCRTLSSMSSMATTMTSEHFSRNALFFKLACDTTEVDMDKNGKGLSSLIQLASPQRHLSSFLASKIREEHGSLDTGRCGDTCVHVEGGAVEKCAPSWGSLSKNKGAVQEGLRYVATVTKVSSDGCVVLLDTSLSNDDSVSNMTRAKSSCATPQGFVNLLDIAMDLEDIERWRAGTPLLPAGMDSALHELGFRLGEHYGNLAVAKAHNLRQTCRIRTQIKVGSKVLVHVLAVDHSRQRLELSATVRSKWAFG